MLKPADREINTLVPNGPAPMNPKQRDSLHEAQSIVLAYRPYEDKHALCVGELKAKISEILEQELSKDESSGRDSVVDLLRLVRAELARNFPDAEVPTFRRRVLH